MATLQALRLRRVIGMRPIVMMLAVWLCFYGVLLLLDHFTLRTNAFDLSVFDYALWSTTNGPRLGYVPFYGQSLLSHHVMPTLWVLWPAHALVPSPVLLIGIQLAAIAAAALLFARKSARQAPPLVAFALVAAFLFSRRSHGAITSVFYIECLEPILVFGFAAAAHSANWKWYWACLVLALGCKEDMAIYTATYGMLLLLERSTRRVGMATVAVSIAWILCALMVWIPWARALDGLAPDYAFITERYGASPLLDSLQRIFRWEALRRVASLTLMVGLLCWPRPKWLLAAVPGILLNLAAKDDALQSGLIGHYLWPIIPFVFLAALDGAVYLHSRWPIALRVWAVLFLVAIALDNPALRPKYLASRVSDVVVAGRIRQALAAVPDGASVLSGPQLVPHLAKRHNVECIGRRWREPLVNPDVVVLTSLGDQWPLTPDLFRTIVAEFSADRTYVRAESMPPELVMFVRRAEPSALAPGTTYRDSASPVVGR